MAQKLSISQRAYSDIESDKVNIDLNRLTDLAEALEIDPALLLTFNEKFIFNISNCHNGYVNQLITESEEHLRNQINDLRDEIRSLKDSLKK